MLYRFGKISSEHYGFVALMFYNGLRGKKRLKEAWMVPIYYWSIYEEAKDRRSIARKDLAVDLGSDYQLVWVPGKGWALPRGV
jgi:hypothetical protein